MIIIIIIIILQYRCCTSMILRFHLIRRKEKHFVHSFIHSSIHPLTHSFCNLTTVPQTPPKPALHTVRRIASSFNFHYHLISSKSYSNCLLLLPRLPVTYTFYLSFNNLFRKAVLTQELTNPFSLPFIYPFKD